MKYNKTKYKVAVLLAGQSRTYKICLPSIQSFFSPTISSIENGGVEIEVDYFMHTWDVNLWLNTSKEKTMPKYLTGLEPAFVEREYIEKKLKSLKGLIVEQFDRANLHNVWGPILYSSYRVNKMKCDFENENGFTYDLVIRTRPDIIFPPSSKMNYDNNQIEHRTIYTLGHYGKMKDELFISNTDDVAYMGDSATMNTAANLYSYAGFKGFYPSYNYIPGDTSNISPEQHLGPGTLMTRYLHQVNIDTTSVHNLYGFSVIRKAALDLNLNYEENYHELVELSKEFYKE